MTPRLWLYQVTSSEKWSGLYRVGILLEQTLTFALCISLAFLLRFEFAPPGTYSRYLWAALLTWAPIKLVVFLFLKLDRGWWRYVSIHDILRLLFGNALASLFCCIAILLSGQHNFPRSIYIIDLLLCFFFTAAERALVRILFAAGQSYQSKFNTRIFIYGAGIAGITLLREIRLNPKLKYNVCGFIDDNPRKKGLVIQGVKVLGCGAELPNLITHTPAAEVLVALPSATGPQMTDVLNQCHSAGLKCRTIPALGEMIEGTGLESQIRDVAVEDLLGRQPVRLEELQIRRSIEGQIVLVTGAAGSIGSELCRQIAKFRPEAIIGFEIAESPLFEIDRELRLSYPQIPFYPEIGSIQNRHRVDEVLEKYEPSIIFHAAAYKHVPLMEDHVFEAIENNVFGTYNVASSAAAHGVDSFVMISSDKAVRPTNMMGATKRVAELLLLGMKNTHTKYVAVRFGNVLGSNGSVIPIFKKQIARGGPVTVTHPEMRRFFMTIPEACQLVLQASVVGEAGQICVLNMGEPVKIVDLARNLILLSGLRPGIDVDIQFTGTRPGEKLYEELSGLLEDTVETSHEQIRIYKGIGLTDKDANHWLNLLEEACLQRDIGHLLLTIKELVPDYNASAHLIKRIVEPKHPQKATHAA